MFERLEDVTSRLPVEPARGRQTPDNTFGAALQQGAQAAAAVVGTGIRAVAPLLPGGSFLSAVASAVDEAASGTGAIGASADPGSMLRAQERLQAEGMANSLQLLALQERMHRESQTYTATSNVMKSRHEMAMAAINNVR